MKKDIHPPYQQVLFIDTATGDRFLCGSTLQTKEREMHEGKEYPACRIPISSGSHPFFTGSQQAVDREGRVSRFKKRYARRQPSSSPAQEPPSAKASTKAKKQPAKKVAKQPAPKKKK